MTIFKRLFGVMLLAALAFVSSAQFCPGFGGAPSPQSLSRIEQSTHYQDGRFRNVLPASPADGDLWKQIKRQFFGEELRHPPFSIPIYQISAADFGAIRPNRPRAAWLGHSSVYIELGGKRILTDPVFSDVASPTPLLGPRRFHPLPIDSKAIPTIDLVVISHDHYDHLDMDTVKLLAPRGTIFAVPLGVSGHLRRWGVPDRQIVELDWGEKFVLGDVTITCTEARHYSGRGITDQRKTLWSSWVLSSLTTRVFFSGDTGYSGHFARIGQEYGPFDLTLIKIGAYGPGNPWSDVHMSAEDAVRAHVDLDGKEMLPIHWSTFNLGFHAWDEPIERALIMSRETGGLIVTPRIGELIEIGKSADTRDIWWRNLDL